MRRIVLGVFLVPLALSAASAQGSTTPSGTTSGGTTQEATLPEHPVDHTEHSLTSDQQHTAKQVMIRTHELREREHLPGTKALDRAIIELGADEPTQEAVRQALRSRMEERAQTPGAVAAAARDPGAPEAPPPRSDPYSEFGEYFKGKNPRNPEVFRDSGRYAYSRGQYQAAFQDFGRAIALGDRSLPSLLGYADSAFKLGDFPLAAQAAQKALALDPQNKDALAVYHFSKDMAPAVRLPSAFDGGAAQDQSAGEAAQEAAAPVGAESSPAAGQAAGA